MTDDVINSKLVVIIAAAAMQLVPAIAICQSAHLQYMSSCFGRVRHSCMSLFNPLFDNFSQAVSKINFIISCSLAHCKQWCKQVDLGNFIYWNFTIIFLIDFIEIALSYFVLLHYFSLILRILVFFVGSLDNCLIWWLVYITLKKLLVCVIFTS